MDRGGRWGRRPQLSVSLNVGGASPRVNALSTAVADAEAASTTATITANILRAISMTWCLAVVAAVRSEKVAVGRRMCGALVECAVRDGERGNAQRVWAVFSRCTVLLRGGVCVRGWVKEERNKAGGKGKETKEKGRKDRKRGSRGAVGGQGENAGRAAAEVGEATQPSSSG